MKIKTAWLTEMRGSLGRPFLGGMSCFRTDKYGNIVGLKSPSEPRTPSGKQDLYRHQLFVLRKLWSVQSSAQKAAYQQKAIELDLTAYDVFIKENYPVGYLDLLPTKDLWINQNHPNNSYTSQIWINISDRPSYEHRALVNYPLNLIHPSVSFTKAELHLNYITEAAWSAEGKEVDIHRVVDDWSDYNPTWNNTPDYSPMSTDSAAMPGEEEWFSFDVTADVNLEVHEPHRIHGWLIKFHDLDPVEDSVSDLGSIRYFEGPWYNYLRLTL